MDHELPAVSEAAADIISAAVDDAEAAAHAAQEAETAAIIVTEAAADLARETERLAAEEIDRARLSSHQSAADTISDYEERVLSLENRLDALAAESLLLQERITGLELTIQAQSTQAPSTEMASTETGTLPEPMPELKPEKMDEEGAALPVVEKPERKRHRFL